MKGFVTVLTLLRAAVVSLIKLSIIENVLYEGLGFN
jgi:hypothetical protein